MGYRQRLPKPFREATHKRCMSRRRESLLDNGKEFWQIHAPECVRIQPQAGEIAGAKDAVGAGFKRLKLAVDTHFPVELVMIRVNDQILANSHPFVEFEFRIQVAVTARHGTLHHKLWSSCGVIALHFRLAAVFRQKLESDVGLRHVCFAHHPSGFQSSQATWCTGRVERQPCIQWRVKIRVLLADSRTHMNDSIN